MVHGNPNHDSESLITYTRSIPMFPNNSESSSEGCFQTFDPIKSELLCMRISTARSIGNEDTRDFDRLIALTDNVDTGKLVDKCAYFGDSPGRGNIRKKLPNVFI